MTMKKRIFTSITSLSVAISIISGCTINTYADDTLHNEIIEKDEQIDLYVGDPALEAYVQEKQRIAEQLYNATISGNTELATQLQTDFNELEKDKLDQIHSKNQVYSNENAVFSYPPPPSSYTINLTHYKQINGYYCGPATAYMILNEMGVSNITQDSLAIELKTTTHGTGWYDKDGSEVSQFPMMQTLNNNQNYRYYIPSPLGQAGSNPLDTTKVKSYVMSSTSHDSGIALCGTSKASQNDASHIPNYPAKDIDHWLTCIGYKSNGSQIYIADPASKYSSSFNNVPQKYYIDAETCQAFIAPRGMIW